MDAQVVCQFQFGKGVSESPDAFGVTTALRQ